MSPFRRFQVASVLVGLGLALASHDARADAGPKISPGWYLPVGIDLGGAFRGGLDNGFVLGAEVSAVRIFLDDDGPDGLWLGPVADIAWDFGSDALRHRAGGEIGLGPLGVEIDYIGELRDELYMPGMGARGFFSLSVVGLYGGYGHLFEDVAGKDWGEFGLLIKIPVPLCTRPRQRHIEPAPEPDEPRIQATEPGAEAGLDAPEGAPLEPPPEGPLVPLEPGRFAEPPPDGER